MADQQELLRRYESLFSDDRYIWDALTWTVAKIDGPAEAILDQLPIRWRLDISMTFEALAEARLDEFPDDGVTAVHEEHAGLLIESADAIAVLEPNGFGFNRPTVRDALIAHATTVGSLFWNINSVNKLVIATHGQRASFEFCIDDEPEGELLTPFRSLLVDGAQHPWAAGLTIIEIVTGVALDERPATRPWPVLRFDDA